MLQDNIMLIQNNMLWSDNKINNTFSFRGSACKFLIFFISISYDFSTPISTIVIYALHFV